MAPMIHYNNCPVCNSTNLKQVMLVKDFTVSGEMFPIMECADCTLRFTQDVPSKENIGRYYASENYISHTDTSQGLINKIYKQVRQFTMRQKVSLVKKMTGREKGNLLEVGSGTGSFAAAMQQRGWQVTGLEPDDNARSIALKNHGIKLLPETDLYKQPHESFDAIVLWHVLEHVHDLHAYIRQFYQLLKPSGRLIIAVPNYTSADGEIYNEHWAAYDVPRHLYHFSPLSMQKLVEKNDLHIKKQLPMWFDSFYISLLSSKYKKGKENWFEALFQGTRSNVGALTDTRKCSSVIYVIGK